MTDSPKSESASPAHDDEDLYSDGRTENPGFGVKHLGLVSDEETTSSSLLPIPDTLRQFRGHLKRMASDAGEDLTEVDSPLSACIITEDISNSLKELRRKYALKNEASVTRKMNSANLMLDDILKSKNLSSSFQSKYANDQEDVKKLTVAESDSSSLVAESVVSTIKHCHHVLRMPNPAHCTPIPYNSVSRSHCHNHDKAYRPACFCSNFHENGLQVARKKESDEKPKKSLSFLEKLQNFHLKYRIQSVYKIVQKNNPFNRERQMDAGGVEQGIPSASRPENSKRDRRKSEDKECSTYRYPRRMVFDLVESSDTCQSESKSTSRESGRFACPVAEGKCTCHDRKECICPELIPECTCEEHFLDFSQCIPVQSSRPDGIAIRTSKINEFAQTDGLHSGNERDLKDQFIDRSLPSPAPNAILNPTVNASVNNKTVNQSGQPPKEFKNNLHNETKPDSRKCYFRSRKLIERTDIYYFDHGNSSYYKTTDNHPMRYTECLVERTDEYATKFWGEIFGFIEIGMAFLISFILQLYRFFFTSVIRSLTVGLLQIFSDYFFKPLLTILFNGIIQPCLILAYNIATSVRDLCFPVSQIFGFFIKEVANLFKSCRIVEINHSHCKQSLPTCNCGNKV